MRAWRGTIFLIFLITDARFAFLSRTLGKTITSSSSPAAMFSFAQAHVCVICSIRESASAMLSVAFLCPAGVMIYSAWQNTYLSHAVAPVASVAAKRPTRGCAGRKCSCGFPTYVPISSGAPVRSLF